MLDVVAAPWRWRRRRRPCRPSRTRRGMPSRERARRSRRRRERRWTGPPSPPSSRAKAWARRVRALPAVRHRRCELAPHVPQSGHAETQQPNPSARPCRFVGIVVPRDAPARTHRPNACAGASRHRRARRRGAPLRRRSAVHEPAASGDPDGGAGTAGPDHRLPGAQRERLRSRPGQHLRRPSRGRFADRHGASADRTGAHRRGGAGRRARGDAARHRPGTASATRRSARSGSSPTT